MSMDQRQAALAAFKDGPTSVFLLSVRSGAVGLTLTAANHGPSRGGRVGGRGRRA